MSLTNNKPLISADKPKPKIAYVITRSDIGGAQFHVLSLIQKMNDNFDLVLISGSEGFLSNAVKKLGIKTEIIPALDSFNLFSASIKVRTILKRERPDLVHVHSSLASIYGRCAASFLGLKTLYTVHGWHFSHEPSLIKKCLKVVIEFSLKPFTDYWITVSQFDYQLGTKFQLFRQGDVETIVNGVNKEAYADKPKNDDTLNAVFVGRATYQKNCKAAIHVLEHTQERVHLTVYASGGTVNKLKNTIENSPAKDRITLILNDPEAASKLTQYSVILVTSRYEGMPLSVLESMQAGLAIVSTDICGMNELVQQGRNGFLLPEYSEKEMADCLDNFFRNPEKLKQMGEESRRIYEEKFTEDRMINATESLYKRLMKRC